MKDMIGKIYCEDCLETMKRMADKSIDLVLTDPPYGIGISSNPVRQKHTKKEWDNNIPMDLIFNDNFLVDKMKGYILKSMNEINNSIKTETITLIISCICFKY